MKSEHRHELKTNELADWLGHLPQWTKENLTSILIVLAIIIAVVFFFAWNSYKQKIAEQEKLEFTTLLNQLSSSKMQVLNAQQDGRDLSFILLQPANNLATFAQNTKNDRMAALALIKRAEALRMELHYRPGTVSQQELTTQISLAEAAYTEAIRKSAADQSLIATAELGLGLCAEELGNFDKAKQIYKDIVANKNLKGVVALASAEYRLKTMDDYKQKIVFKPAPPTAPSNAQSKTTPVATQPKIQITPADPNMVPANLPIQITAAPNNISDAGPSAPNLAPTHGPPAPDNLPKTPEPNVPK
jgi:tetratricopeptide (TPR) repeat protein